MIRRWKIADDEWKQVGLDTKCALSVYDEVIRRQRIESDEGERQ